MAIPAGVERALTALVDHADDAIAIAVTTAADPVTRIVRANEALCRITGYTAEQLVGQSPGVLVGPDTDLETLRRMQDALRLDQSSTEELVVHRADGTPVRVEATYRRVEGDDDVTWYIATYRDRADRARAAQTLWLTEEWAQALLRSATDVILVTDEEATIRWITPSAQRRLGYQPDELVGTSCWDLLHTDELADAHHDWAGAVEGTGVDRPSVLRIRCADGSWRVMNCTATDLRHHPAISGFVVSASDVTDQAATFDLLSEQTELLESMARGAPLEVTLQQLAQLVERHIPGTLAALAVTDEKGRLHTRAAPSLAREIVNRLDDIDLTTSEVGEALRATGGTWRHWDLTTLEKLADDPMRLAHGLTDARATMVLAPGNGEILGMISVFSTQAMRASAHQLEVLDRVRNLAALAIERQRFESALEHRTLYDPLTGLPNRALLMQRMTESTRRGARLGYGVAVLFFDIDRFRVINDSLGHEAGDRLLSLVSDRLVGRLRPGDTMGRLGGDKFLVVCNRIGAEEDALQAARQLLEGLDEPFRMHEAQGPMVLTASVGIVLSIDHTLDPESLVRNAEVAMYRAKDQGRNQYVVFTEHVDLRAVEKLSLEQALRVAIESDELELYMQPIVAVSDHVTRHVEALVRWNRPGEGLVLPGTFIPVAEESGLIVPLGNWVLEQACQAAAGWSTTDEGHDLGIAVNLSARQLSGIDLLDIVHDALDRSGLAPSRLCLEVTESALVHDVDGAKATLLALKDLGVRIAIDDFGTGYATLDYIRHFSMADELKIDRAFIDGVEREGSHESAIVAAAVAIARSLGALTVAEGVETPEQAAVLAGLGVDLAQGFLFNRPMPLHQLTGAVLATGQA